MVQLDFFGDNAKLHHIGIAVKSIIDASPSGKMVADPMQNVAVAFVLVNGVVIELVEPRGKNSPIYQSLRKGLKLLHICYEVPDLTLAINRSKNFGFHRIAGPTPAAAFEGRKIAWVYSSKYGLFELLQSSN